MKIVISTQSNLILETNLRKRVVKALIYLLILIIGIGVICFNFPPEYNTTINPTFDLLKNSLHLGAISNFNIIAFFIIIIGFIVIYFKCFTNFYKLEFFKDTKQLLLSIKGSLFKRSRLIYFNEILSVEVKEGLFYKDNAMYGLNLSNRQNYNRTNQCSLVLRTRKGTYTLLKNDGIEYCKRISDRITTFIELNQKQNDPFYN
ncbi:MAG: hypothetical protein AB1782_09960 [Cyanobacteriota bacterium]